MKKLIITLAVLATLGGISLLSAGIGYVAHKHDWVAKTHARLVGRTPACCGDELSEILGFTPEENSIAWIDQTREFVHTNSKQISQITAHGAAAYDTGGVIRNLIATHHGKQKPAELLCSSRANAMSGLLETVGIESRQVHLFSQHNGSHTFLEVKDPESGTWSIQDPDYNLIWQDTQTGKRLDLAGLISLPVEQITPCQRDGKCGWHLAENLQVYTGAGLWFNFDARPVLLTNPEKFDMAAPLSWAAGQPMIESYANMFWAQDYGPVLAIQPPTVP